MALGGGDTIGTMNYVGEPVPRVLALCALNLRFTLGTLDDPTGGWQSQAFVLNAAGSEYAGPVRITGGGGSDNSCESYSIGGGVMTMELSGSNPLTGASLACNDDAGDPTASRPVTGRYTRVGPDLTAVVTGRCLVNGTPVGQVTFLVDVQAVPRDAAGGEGLTRPVQSMVATGALVRPAA